MSKQINVIVYRPGLGGMFLTYILSMHSSTMMPGRDFGVADRTQQWTYRQLRQTHGSWLAHHRSLAYDLPYTIRRYMSNRGTRSLTVSTHPWDFYQRDSAYIQGANADIKYLYIALDQIHQPRLEDFFAKNPWPANTDLSWHDVRHEVHERIYVEQYQPYQIDFAEIMHSESGFMQQYHQINRYLDLPNIDDLAVREYRYWRQARGLNEVAGEVGIEPTTG